MRSKDFDVKLCWVGRYRNVEYAKFYAANFEERLKMSRDAREGGSITPEMMGKLRAFKESGALKICEKTCVEACDWSDDKQCWNMDLCVGKTKASEELCADTVWLATGWFVLLL